MTCNGASSFADFRTCSAVLPPLAPATESRRGTHQVGQMRHRAATRQQSGRAAVREVSLVVPIFVREKELRVTAGKCFLQTRARSCATLPVHSQKTWQRDPKPLSRKVAEPARAIDSRREKVFLENSVQLN